jgi:hypothetical protein
VHIKYKDPIAAFYCQQFLDGEYIQGLKANLIVKWIDHNKEQKKRDAKQASIEAEEVLNSAIKQETHQNIANLMNKQNSGNCSLSLFD